MCIYIYIQDITNIDKIISLNGFIGYDIFALTGWNTQTLENASLNKDINS